MERKFDRESEGPQWVQAKAPQPILDLVNFDLFLRGFPSFKIRNSYNDAILVIQKLQRI
jgi:hypothetical protein